MFIQVMESLLVVLCHKKTSKFNQCRKVCRSCVQRVHTPFLYVSSHQRTEIIITFNMLTMIIISLTTPFLFSLLIEYFVTNLYADQNHSRNLLNWQEMNILLVMTFLWIHIPFLIAWHWCATLPPWPWRYLLWIVIIVCNLLLYYIHFLTYYFLCVQISASWEIVRSNTWK